MSDKQLLDKISGIIVANNKVLLRAMDEKIRESEIRVTQKLSKKITESQEDTQDFLREMIETGYNMHEKRIKRIEDHLGFSSAKVQ